VSITALALPREGEARVTDDPTNKKAAWHGPDNITTVEFEMTDTILNKFTGERAYWFDMNLNGFSINENATVVNLDFSVSKNNLTNLLLAPDIIGDKTTLFSSNYSFMGERVTADNLAVASQEITDIPLTFSRGSARTRPLKVEIDCSYSMIVELEQVNAAVWQSKFKFGSNSWEWSVSTQTNWGDNTENSDNIEIIDGAIQLEFITDTGWSYYKDIIISHTLVENENLENFPLLINIVDNDLQNRLEFENGQDICFTDESGDNLSYELENWDNSTGRLVAWVRIPWLYDNVSTTITMWYGNASSDNNQDINGVWDDNYVFVHHLAGNPTGIIRDSTSNAHDNTPNAMGAANQTWEYIGGSLDFNGTDETLDVGDIFQWAERPTTHLTLSCWYKNDTLIGDHRMSGSEASNGGITVFTFGNSLRGLTGDGASLNYPQLSVLGEQDNWNHVAFTYNDDDVTEGRLYLNGNQVATNSTNLGLISYYQNIHHFVGSDANTGNTPTAHFDGQITEARLSNTARSSEWIRARISVENENIMGTYITYSDEQIAGVYQSSGEWVSVNWELGIRSMIDNLVLAMSTDVRGEFDLSDEIDNPYGFDFEPIQDYWYVIDANDRRLNVFDSEWGYQGHSAILDNSGSTTGVYYPTGNWLICDSVGAQIDNYDTGYNYLNSFSVSGEMTDPSNVHYRADEKRYYVLSANTDNVFKYNSFGVYYGVDYDLGLTTEAGEYFFDYDGEYWWVGDPQYGILRRYDNDFNLIDNYRCLLANDAAPRDINVDAENIYMIGNGSDTVYRYLRDNTQDNIYARIGYDTDNDNSLDGYSSWYLMPENGYWINPNIPDAFNYNVSFRLETADNAFSPKIAAFSMNADYAREWVSAENWLDNLEILPKVWQSVESWANRLSLGFPEPLFPLDALVSDVIVPLILLFAPAFAMMKKLKTIGFLIGMTLGAILAYSVAGFTFGLFILLIVTVVILWHKGRS